MRTCGPLLLGAVVATMLGLAGCDGSTGANRSSSQPAPVAIVTCGSSVTVPTDTTRAVPSGSIPPTVVIRTGDALSLDVPDGSTLGLGAPVGRGDGAVLCRASRSAAGAAELVGRRPGFARVAVADGNGRQLVVNVQVTV